MDIVNHRISGDILNNGVFGVSRSESRCHVPLNMFQPTDYHYTCFSSFLNSQLEVYFLIKNPRSRVDPIPRNDNTL